MKVTLAHMAEIDGHASRIIADGVTLIDKLNAEAERRDAPVGDAKTVNAASLMISAILRQLARTVGPGAAVAAIGQSYGTMLSQTPPEHRLAMTENFAAHMRATGEGVERDQLELARMRGDTAGQA